MRLSAAQISPLGLNFFARGLAYTGRNITKRFGDCDNNARLTYLERPALEQFSGAREDPFETVYGRTTVAFEVSNRPRFCNSPRIRLTRE
jgi:hypothetical protein